MDFGDWRATVRYGAASRRGGAANGNATPIGRALIAKIGPNEFWVTGAFCRVDFRSASGGQRDFLRVEEVATDPQGPPRFVRIWNGDETDSGLNFSSAPQPLRVKLGTY
jgi:hypothetical protein